MKPILTFAEEAMLVPTACSFAVRHSREIPAYYELTLEDGQGDRARWVVPLPLKQLAKRPVLLWQLATSPLLGSLACLETGSVRLAADQPGVNATLPTELAQGVLRLHFNGQLLRGYYRLQCLSTGGGQLWQFTPIGWV